MFDPDFLELMPLVCELKPLTSWDVHGKAIYGTSIFPHCHVRYTSGKSYQIKGEVIPETGVVYLDGSYPVDANWGLSIPQPGGANENVTVLGVDQTTDEDGWYATAVHFGAL